MVWEIVINVVQRGQVDASAQRYLSSASGGSELAEILAAAIGSVDVVGVVESREDQSRSLENRVSLE